MGLVLHPPCPPYLWFRIHSICVVTLSMLLFTNYFSFFLPIFIVIFLYFPLFVFPFVTFFFSLSVVLFLLYFLLSFLFLRFQNLNNSKLIIFSRLKFVLSLLFSLSLSLLFFFLCLSVSLFFLRLILCLLFCSPFTSQ